LQIGLAPDGSNLQSNGTWWIRWRASRIREVRENVFIEFFVVDSWCVTNNRMVAEAARPKSKHPAMASAKARREEMIRHELEKEEEKKEKEKHSAPLPTESTAASHWPLPSL
jgi:hypothetical protein